jgi:hypothetical protein
VYDSLGNEAPVKSDAFTTPKKKKNKIILKVIYFCILIRTLINWGQLLILILCIFQRGMLFDDVDAAQDIYKEYAHNIGFSIRIGHQRYDDNGVVQWKRFLCAREGYYVKRTKLNDPSDEMCRTRETRCGCQAYIYVKRTSEGKYEIAALYEGHNHAFVTLSKHHLLRSNRRVSEKAKTMLF